MIDFSLPDLTDTGGSVGELADLRSNDRRRNVGVARHASQRAVVAEHYVKAPARNRKPVGRWNADRELWKHVNRGRAVPVGLQPGSVAAHHILVRIVRDQGYRVRDVRGDGPKP